MVAGHAECSYDFGDESSLGKALSNFTLDCYLVLSSAGRKGDINKYKSTIATM